MQMMVYLPFKLIYQGENPGNPRFSMLNNSIVSKVSFYLLFAFLDSHLLALMYAMAHLLQQSQSSESFQTVSSIRDQVFKYMFMETILIQPHHCIQIHCTRLGKLLMLHELPLDK